MIPIKDLREDVAIYVGDSGVCADSPKVVEAINAARSLLWKRGDFKGTVSTFSILAFEKMLTLPSDCVAIREAQICGEPVGIDTLWYENASNISFATNHSCMSSLIDLGDKFASFKDYEDGKFRIAIKAESVDDKGKKVVFGATGEHYNDQQIHMTLGDDHEYIYDPNWIKYFRVATKDITTGRVLVYIYDPNNGIKDLCAIFQPEDTTIQLRRYRVRGLTSKAFFVKAKKRFRKLSLDTDLVEFDTDTIIQALTAITARRNKDSAGFTAALNLAVESANQEIKEEKILSEESKWLARL